MSGAIYLQRGQGNQYTDQVYQSLLQYAMIANRNKNIKEEREWQTEQINQRRRDNIEDRYKNYELMLKEQQIAGNIKKVGNMPQSVDKAKTKLDSGDYFAGNGEIYERTEKPKFKSIPLVDSKGNVYGVMNQSPDGKTTFSQAPQSPKGNPLEEMGYYEVGNKIIRFVEGQEKPELVFDGDKQPGKWTNPIVSKGGTNDTFPKGTVYKKNLETNDTVVLSKPKTDGSPKSTFNEQAKLRGEYNKISQTYVTVRDAFGRIKASSTDPSPAGDLALIFNYMKVLDPGSTVREGEFATAADSASLPKRLVAKYNKVVSGERLAAETRRDFVARATKLYDRQLKSHKSITSQYRNLASKYEFDPDKIVMDYVVDFDKKPIINKTQQDLMNQYGIKF